MLLSANLDLRREPRKILTGLLPGSLRIEDSEDILNCKPTNISPNGLGVLIDKEIPIGNILIFKFRDKNIPLKIIWRQPDLGRQNKYRYGLELVDSNENLENIFITGGCLKIL